MTIKHLFAIPVAALLASASAGAFAQVSYGTAPGQFGPHDGTHQIEHRLRHQEERIFFKLRSGLITPAQAGGLRAQEAQVRDELRVMEARDGGLITPLDQRRLNRHLDQISRQIGA